MKKPLPQHEIDALVDTKGVTLNGKPAKIQGRLEGFANVSELDGPLSVQYAWSTVKNIVASGGQFKAN